MCKIKDFIMLLFLLWCSISDLRTKKIPTVLLIIMSLTVIMIRLIFIRQEIAGMAGGALMGAIFWLISKYTNQAIGYGDSWLLGNMGIYLGGISMLEVATTAFFLTGLVSLAGIVIKQWKKNVTVPFAPFLTAAYLGVIDHAVKKNQNGSFTIEASFVVPIILMVFMASVYIIFYFHDKNILSGAAYETAVVGSERKSYKKEELEAYFRRRIKGKLIVFSNVKENIEVEREKITVTCSAKKRRMKIKVSASVKQTEPETYIRNVRKIKKIEEKIGDTK